MSQLHVVCQVREGDIRSLIRKSVLFSTSLFNYLAVTEKKVCDQKLVCVREHHYSCLLFVFDSYFSFKNLKGSVCLFDDSLIE